MVEKSYIYCDESCQNAHRYMVIGSVTVKASNIAEVIKRLEDVKTKPRAAKGELKWTKLSPYGLSTYTDFIGQFNELRKEEKLQYHCIIVDTAKVDHAKYHGGDRELGFSKFIYQLLLKYSRINDKDTHFYCYLDDRTTVHTPEELRRILNNGANKKYGTKPYKIIEFLDSKKSILIQITDVITGAIAYRKNEKDVTLPASNAKVARDDLSAQICASIGILNLCDQTPLRIKDFTIWNIKLD